MASEKPSVDLLIFLCEVDLIRYLTQHSLNCHHKDKNYKGEKFSIA